MRAVIFILSLLVLTTFVNAEFGYGNINGPVLSPSKDTLKNLDDTNILNPEAQQVIQV